MQYACIACVHTSCARAHKCIHACTKIYTQKYIAFIVCTACVRHVYVYLSTCVREYTCIRVHVGMYVYEYVYAHTHACTHTSDEKMSTWMYTFTCMCCAAEDKCMLGMPLWCAHGGTPYSSWDTHVLIYMYVNAWTSWIDRYICMYTRVCTITCVCIAVYVHTCTNDKYTHTLVWMIYYMCIHAWRVQYCVTPYACTHNMCSSVLHCGVCCSRADPWDVLSCTSANQPNDKWLICANRLTRSIIPYAFTPLP